MLTKLYIHWRQFDWQDDGELFVCTDVFSEIHGAYKLLKTIEVEIDFKEPTREDIALHKAADLNRKKKALLAETHQKIAEIDDKLMHLAALTYSPEADIRSHAEDLDEL